MRALLLRLALALAGLAGTASAPLRAEVLAVAAELAPAGEGRVRLVLTLSGPVAASALLLDGPDRAVIDLPGVDCRLGPGDPFVRSGLVAGFRCGLAAPGRSRLVIDLAAPALVGALEWREGPAAGAVQLAVPLSPADRETFRREARRASPETTGSLPPGPDAAPPEPRLPVIAIDAGHGGADPGAIAPSGAAEKDVVLAFARSLRQRLAEGGRLRVVMIRDQDVFVPLDDRVRRAREAGADLFVSVHADSISHPAVRGATLYTGADRASDGESARLADRENAADAAGGVAARVPGASVQDILHDLTGRETRTLSHRFAGYLRRDMSGAVRFSAQPQREAGFRVLRAHDIPSVLVELGYMSNALEADMMLSEPWRDRASAAMAQAIERFFAPRLAGRAAVSP